MKNSIKVKMRKYLLIIMGKAENNGEGVKTRMVLGIAVGYVVHEKFLEWCKLSRIITLTCLPILITSFFAVRRHLRDPEVVRMVQMSEIG